MIRGVLGSQGRGVLFSFGLLLGCAAPAPGPPPVADGSRPESAEAIAAYLDEFEALHWEECPQDFRAAFRRHGAIADR